MSGLISPATFCSLLHLARPWVTSLTRLESFPSCKLILKLQLSAYLSICLYLSYLFTLWLSIYLFHFKVSLSSQLRFVILHNLCYTTNIYYYSNPVNYCACSLELPSRNRCNRKLKKHTYAISQFRNPARIGIYVMAISNF